MVQGVGSGTSMQKKSMVAVKDGVRVKTTIGHASVLQIFRASEVASVLVRKRDEASSDQPFRQRSALRLRPALHVYVVYFPLI